ncbi:MAG: hypothetical protein J7521_16960 [Caulobacter sp.]|nr:hypothetical protein [Caulobacter sp.]
MPFLLAPAPPPAAAPAPAAAKADERSAVVCVRATGRRPLTFSGALIPKKPGAAKPPGAFDLPLTANGEQCNHLLRSKVADWSLSVNTPGFTACRLAAPEYGYRVTYTATASARGLKCAQAARAPIGPWK